MTITYRYYFTDLATGDLVDELPLYGVNFSEYLRDREGSFTGTIRMDTPTRTPADIIEATREGRRMVWVERIEDGVSSYIWHGIIWTVTYASQSRTLQIYAATLTSYAKHVINTVDRNWTTKTASNIVLDIWRIIQSEPLRNLRVEIPNDFSNPSGSLVTKTVVGNEYNNFADIIKSLQDLEYGPEIVIQPFFSTYSTPQRRSQLIISDSSTTVGIGRVATDDRVCFQYPGTIARYWWPTSASKAATHLYGIGKALDASTPRVTVIDVPEGYPHIHKRVTFPTAETTAQLTSRLQREIGLLRPPVVAPTFEIIGERNIQWTRWGIGDYVDFIVDDRFRFPRELYVDGAKWTDRVVAWELTPGKSDEPAKLVLALAKEEMPSG